MWSIWCLKIKTGSSGVQESPHFWEGSDRSYVHFLVHVEIWGLEMLPCHPWISVGCSSQQHLPPAQSGQKSYSWLLQTLTQGSRHMLFAARNWHLPTGGVAEALLTKKPGFTKEPEITIETVGCQTHQERKKKKKKKLTENPQLNATSVSYESLNSLLFGKINLTAPLWFRV